MISVTDLAAEKISKAQEGQDMDGKMLRIGVYSAGCSGGYQYALGFDAKSDQDSMFESNGLEVIVKSEDVDKVNGTEIDYVISGKLDLDNILFVKPFSNNYFIKLLIHRSLSNFKN